MPKVLGGATVDGKALIAEADYILNPVTGELIEFRDFIKSGAAAKAGVDLATVVNAPGRKYRMVPYTSTVAAEVNAQTPGSSILYNLLIAGGLGESTRESGIELSGFTLEGTQQGHSYNGLNVRYSRSAHIHDLLITGIPGTKSSPPEETFSMNLWHADGSRVERVTVDGLGIAASLFGLNSVNDCRLLDCEAHNTKVAFALAMWQSGNVVVQNFDASNNRRAINIERPYGPYTLEACDVRGTARPHITCNGDGKAAGAPVDSVPLKVIEPIIDIPSQGPLRIGISTNPYLGKPQTQKVSDVQVIMGGKDVTNDSSKVLIGEVW